MKKSILIIALALVSAVSFGQTKETAAKKQISSKETVTKPSQTPVDTTKIKNGLFTDQSIMAIYSTIETVKKGLPGSKSISAADASESSAVLNELSKQLAIIYNERHPANPSKK